MRRLGPGAERLGPWRVHRFKFLSPGDGKADLEPPAAEPEWCVIL
jgi:hypothetical protein